MDSTFTFSGPAQLTGGGRPEQKPADKNQNEQIAVGRDGAALTQWVTQATKGAFGTAIVLPSAGITEDPLNELILAPVESGKPLRYYLGAAWDRAGHVKRRPNGRKKSNSRPPAPPTR
jgi:pectinesterase